VVTACTVTSVSSRGLDVVRLTAPQGAQATVALDGATLLAWRSRLPLGAPGPAGRLEPTGSVWPAEPADPIELVDGYRDAAERHGQEGVRSGVMAPFVNRIADGRYDFDGRRHDLLPGVPAGRRTTYHGFLRLLRTTLAQASTTSSSATVRLTASIRPDTAEGYPFALDVEVRYTLGAASLALEITARNAGPEPAPYAAGWHPYFTLGTGPVDDLELSVPAVTVVRTRDLLPLPGPAALEPVTRRPDLDFRLPRPIGGHRLDVAFAGLVPDDDGWSTTLLRNPATGAQLRIRQPNGLLHVFTGDTLARDRRASIALEPVEVMTDAFNRPDCRSRITLAPGQARTFRCAVEVG
jgi:aldose 1-epimerase